MNHEWSRPKAVAGNKQANNAPGVPMITYGDLLRHVRDRRDAELEAERPGQKNNANARSNTTRSLTAFMSANNFVETDAVGDEFIGKESLWYSGLMALGSDSTARRQRSELNARVRPWAMELVRSADLFYDDETFGERLARLRKIAGMTVTNLARAIVNGSETAPMSKISNWEKGVGRPDPSSQEEVILISTVLGVPPGYLLEKMPKYPRQARSYETGLPRSIQRRVAQHLPADFETRSLEERDVILSWISVNILSTPKEILEDGSVSSADASLDLSIYALSRKSSGRMILAPDRLIEELDDIQSFKTGALVSAGKVRNEKWGSVSAEKADYELRAFMGALLQIGIPEESLSLSVCLCPDVIDQFIEWKRARRGGYTRAIEKPLVVLESLLNPEYGLIAQTPGFGEALRPVSKLISNEDVHRVQDGWADACAYAKGHLHQRLKEIAQASEKGRDPFESLLSVLEAEDPLGEYYKIVSEIRKRMPDDTYPVRRAEAFRSLMIFRLGLELCFRQKNLRELLLSLPGQRARSWKDLKRLKRGELSFNSEFGWQVRMPREAFKNASSKAVSDENVFPLIDRDGLYGEMDDYLNARTVLLGEHTDPGTVFLKTTRAKSTTAEYDQAAYYDVFRSIITTYGIYNPFTGNGAIKGLRPHGPHSIRHVVATASVKRIRGYSDAAALLMDSEDMVRETYARFLPGERHTLARKALWAPLFDGSAT